MYRLADLYAVLNAAAPFENAMDFDNVGILVGSGETTVRRVMLALDITPDVVEEAASKNVDVILSHHPVIFDPLKAMQARDAVYLLARHGIAALCCHTNLDMAADIGVNAGLAKLLGLRQTRGACPFGTGHILHTGLLEAPMSPVAFAEKVKRDLSVFAVQMKLGHGEIRKVCLCGGAGGEYVQAAFETGADAFLTGEMKHHEMLAAAQLPFTVVAAGHYATEKPFSLLLLPYLQKNLPEVGFVLSAREKNPMPLA